MDHVVARMRRDFSSLAAAAGWGAERERTVGLAIKAAIDGQEYSMVAAWCHWLIAGLESPAVLPPVPSRGVPVAGCLTCPHRTIPGHAGLGYCDRRPDQPLAYGSGHPLHRLPDDLGRGCIHWSAPAPSAYVEDRAFTTAAARPSEPSPDLVAAVRSSFPVSTEVAGAFNEVFPGTRLTWVRENGAEIGRCSAPGVKLSETVVGPLNPPKEGKRK